MRILKHVVAPTLRTVRMIEETVAKGDSIMTVAWIKKHLPRQVNHNTLLEVLEYLQSVNRIYVSVKGITYTPPSPALQKIIDNSYELMPDGTWKRHKQKRTANGRKST